MNDAELTGELIDSYARWRSSRLGRITDALEQQLLFECLGSVAGKTLLDVGCGDGALTVELARRGAIVTGLDADAAMIAAARRRCRGAGIRLQLIEGQAETLPFDDATFDYVIAITVLCFVRDAGHAVGGMARVLRPGGCLLIGDLHRWSLWAAQRRIRGWFGHRTWRNVKFRSKSDLRHLAGAAGLRAIALRGAVHYPPCAAMARLFLPIDAWLGRHASMGPALSSCELQSPDLAKRGEMAADCRQRKLICFLRSLGTDATVVPYPAHSTMEEGRALRGAMPGTFTKNLLLKDKKDRLFLVVAEESRSVDLRTLHTKICANGWLGFASSDTVRDLLQVEPGSITPLALMHDSEKATTVVLDRKMNDAQLNFHPLINTASVGLTPADLERFFAATGHRYLMTELDS